MVGRKGGGELNAQGACSTEQTDQQTASNGQQANEHKSVGNKAEADAHTRTGKSPWNVLQMVAALLLLKALAACGAGNGAVLLQPGLKSLVMRLILEKRTIIVLCLLLKCLKT